MAMNRSGRSRPRHLAAVVVVFALLISPAAAAAFGAPTGEVDIALFSTRAAAWSRASVEQRVDALSRAALLGEEAQQAEVAAEEARVEQERREAEARAQRDAEAAAAALTTTSTTAAPTSTAPATTTPESQLPPSPTTPESQIPSSTTTAAPANVGGPTAAQWEGLRRCESGGRYDAVSSNLRYRGAYQFSQATWDWVAGGANPALVGVDPAGANPADQDAQALALWNLRGSSPWPTCGAHLN
jgi:hypothetical protein